MVVKIKTYPKILTDAGSDYERMIECDTIHKTISSEAIMIQLYKDGKLKEDMQYTGKTRIYIMENGKTIDRIDFKVNQQ